MGTLLLVKAEMYCRGESSSNISCAGEQLCSMWWHVGGFLHWVGQDGVPRGWGAASSRALLPPNSKFCRKMGRNWVEEKSRIPKLVLLATRAACCSEQSPVVFPVTLCQEMQPAGLSAVGDAGAARGHGGFVWCWRPNPRALEQRQRAGAGHEPCRSPRSHPASLQAWTALKLHDGAAEGESRRLVPSSCLDTSLLSAGCFGWNKTLRVSPSCLL